MAEKKKESVDKHMVAANGLYAKLVRQIQGREPKTRIVATLAKELHKVAKAGNKFGSKPGAEVTKKIEAAEKEVTDSLTASFTIKSENALIGYQRKVLALVKDDKTLTQALKTKFTEELKKIELPQI